ncbi:hypothetical protein EOW65_15790 [Sinirhodobacter ferrireducens]|uniref:Uncharacterized protein n=1 Tax=Paenirhodobacter ferrireducens TaxID=1215032 RepID=A0A443L972_9RHOB|nr:hypothetical protein [Sinirhodobacter ferrireducens]RWR45700.1 hypothetical protein EOW65_15790 [Sinirhodobacter ferrireducens]
MSGYVYKGAGHPRGMFNSPEIEAKANKAKELFDAGIPVVSTNDGLDFVATKSRPRPTPEEPVDDTPPEEPTIA